MAETISDHQFILYKFCCAQRHQLMLWHFSIMDGKKCVSLEEQEEYHSVVTQTFRTEEEFFTFYNSYAEFRFQCEER